MRFDIYHWKIVTVSTDMIYDNFTWILTTKKCFWYILWNWNYEIFCHSVFTWNRFLTILRDLNFQPKTISWNNQNQNSEPLRLSKWKSLVFPTHQSWFHVKSEWQKNSQISTLWLKPETKNHQISHDASLISAQSCTKYYIYPLETFSRFLKIFSFFSDFSWGCFDVPRV